MAEFLGLLIVLAILLFLVTVFGHGLWLAAAWLLRTIGGSPEGTKAVSKQCPQCGSVLKSASPGCAACGWPAKLAPPARQTALLKALQGQLQRYASSELIDAECLARLTASLNDEQARLAPPATEIITAELVAAEAVAETPSSPLAISQLQTVQPQPQDPAARAREYMARQTALARLPAEPEITARQEKPSRPWSEVLAGFLEEKNIRWGELVGGLLIVCCSIALVISFWSAIAERPFLKFFVFNGVTAGLFAVGFYSQRRLKLPHTSQGLLMIATLLAPLNFLAIAAFSRGPALTNVFVIGGELISIAIFTVLVYLAGKSITAPWSSPLVLGVMGTSIAQLLVRRWVDPGEEVWSLYAIAAIPLACYAGSVMWPLMRWPRHALPKEAGNCVHAFFRLLGLVTFAVLLPAGLLLAKSEAPVETLRLLAPLMSLGGMPLLLAGLVLIGRISHPAAPAEEPSPNLALLTTAATAIAVLGALIFVAGIPLAWPSPAQMLAISVVGSLLFAAVAFRLNLAPAHLLAAGSFGLAAIIGTHVFRGDLNWTETNASRVLQVLASSTSGVALLPVCFLIIAAAVLSRRWRRMQDTPYLTCGATGLSAISLALVAWHAIETRSATNLAGPLLGISVVWLASSWLMRWPRLFTSCQALLSVAVAAAVGARLEATAWFQQADWPWLDPWTLQALGIALAALGLVWTILRIVARQFHEQAPTLAALLNPPWLSFDRAMNVVLLVLLIALVVYGAVPGVAQELTPRTLALELNGRPHTAGPGVVAPLSAFELPGIPHEHALGYGTWLLGGLLILVFLAGQWERYTPWRILGVVLVLAMACPLLANFWTPEVAAASALRWLTASFLLLGSAIVWRREPLARIANRLGWPGWGEQPAALSRDCRALLLAIVVLFLASMGGYVALAAVLPGPIPSSVSSAFPGLASVTLLVAVLALAMRLTPSRIFAEQNVQSAWHSWSRQVSTLLLILGAAPLVAVSLFVVTMALRGNPIAGPDPASVFYRMGMAVSYAVPIVLIALALVGHALRERSPGFAFTAGLLFNAAATAGYLLALRSAQLDAVLWIRLAQVNAIVSAGYALAWLAAMQWRDKESRAAPALLITQAMLPIALVLLILIPTGITLWSSAVPAAAHRAAGHWLGWASFAMAAACGAWLGRKSDQRPTGGAAWCAAAALAILISMTVSRADTGNWLAMHTLLAGQLVAAGVSLIVARRAESRSEAAHLWPASLIITAIALRGAFDDPHGPWWSIGALLSLALLLALAASMSLRQRFLYLASMAINLAASVWWIEYLLPSVRRQSASGIVEFLQFNAMTLALPAIAWLWIELRAIRPRLADPFARRRWPMHATAAFVSLLVLGGTVALGLVADLLRDSMTPRAWVGWTALAAVAVALIASLWDVSRRISLFGLYVLGLVAVGLTVDQFNLQSPRFLAWTGAMIAGAYALGTSYLWSRREGLRRFATAVGVPQPAVNDEGPGWLVPANGLLISIVLIAAFWVDLTFSEQSLRLLTGKAALFQTLSMGLLAHGARRSKLQATALMVGVIAAVAWGWAWLDPDTTGSLLNRAVVATAALAVMIVLYGLGLAKLLPSGSEWTAAARRLVPTLIGLAGVSMAFILTTEVVMWLNHRHVPMAPLAILVVSAALLGLAVAAVAAAVLPGRDPLGLSERGRTAYVYAAEVLLALLVMHIRLTMPWLFSGLFSRYWTFIVVLVAFLGVGLSEFFARRKQNVLAEPLQRTGAFLPLLPVLGFWVSPAGPYSILLFSVGAVYATLAVMRKSFGFGILAALAANGGLWYLLHRVEGYGLLEHPQLWCIPPAVCVLVAAWLNRDRLSAEQMTSIRYLTSIVIYVSSTADIFLNGVAEAPWLPLVLAGISLMGIFAGILLRVRAFLFLGTSFLMLSLLTIIWHAAHDLNQTWIWAASGIVAGIVIIALFALFEKKRQEVLRLVDQLKEWD